jgi:hypothetical protein
MQEIVAERKPEKIRGAGGFWSPTSGCGGGEDNGICERLS